MLTKYLCTACNYSGQVRYERNAGVYQIRNLIDSDHSKKSPHCFKGLSFIKVENSATRKRNLSGNKQ